MTNTETNGWERLFVQPGYNGNARGGLFCRGMGLGRFIKECDSKGYHIVGILVDEGNNVQLYFEQAPEPEATGDVDVEPSGGRPWRSPLEEPVPETEVEATGLEPFFESDIKDEAEAKDASESD